MPRRSFLREILDGGFGKTFRFAPSADGRAAAWIAACVAVEAVVVLLVLQQGQTPVLSGDGPGYHRIAVNLLAHGRFSLREVPPYEPVLSRTPGYPLFIAAVYLVSNHSLAALRTAQFVLLAGTAWLLYLLATVFVQRAAAMIAALICATYPPFVFMTTIHLSETLSTFLAVLFVLLMVRTLEDPRRRTRDAVAMGLTAGLSALVRPSALFLIIAPLSILTWRALRSGGQGARRLLVWTVVSFLFCLSPWITRNVVVTHKFIPLGTGSGWSLYFSAQQYAGEISYRVTTTEWERMLADYHLREQEAARAANQGAGALEDVPAEVRQELALERQYLSDATQKLHGISWPQLGISLMRRLAYLWSTGDTSPWAAPGEAFHRFVQVHFAVLALLVAAGAWLCWEALATHWPLWCIPIYLSLVHMVFGVVPRYSFPGRAFLLVYAGVALAQVMSLPRNVPGTVNTKLL